MGAHDDEYAAAKRVGARSRRTRCRPRRLALHFFAAASGGDAERAVAACVRAGDRAYELLAYEQSTDHYEQALGE